MEGLTNLKILDLGSTQVTDAGIAHLKKALPQCNISKQSLEDSLAALEEMGADIQKDQAGNVTSIDFKGTPITDVGLVPLADIEHLKGLTSLKSLKLSNTQITDAGLVHLKGLTSLKHLYLYKTQVTDAGLEHLQGLTSLEWLGLENTQVAGTGLVHLKGLTSLITVSLGGPQVTDAGLKPLKGLTNLGNLYLSGSQVTNAGLLHLKELTNLYTLSLEVTNITDVGLVHLKALTSLKHLYVRSDLVTDAGLGYLKKTLPQCNIVKRDRDGRSFAVEDHAVAVQGPLGALKKMGARIQTGYPKDVVRSIDLSGTKVTDAALEHLKGLESLTSLDLRNTQITDAGLEHLKGLKSLTSLDLRNTQVTDAGFVYLTELERLKFLRLEGTQVTDGGFVHLKGLTSLEWLELKGTQVTDAGLEHLKGLTSLKNLTLFETQVAGDGLVHLKGLTSLEWLDLNSTKVTDAGLEHLEGLTSLNSLQLNRTQVTDAGLVHLQGLTSLSLLALGSTQVTDTGLEHLKGLTSLKNLTIGPQVTDAGLEHLKGLTSLERLTLGSTQITDDGLEHLKGLTNLKSLPLYRTQVTDAGLVHLKGMTSLEILTLFDTQVADAGLVHLKGLTRLKWLFLSSTQVTDAGLEHLKGLTRLERLHLYGTQVTDAGLEHLKGLTSLRVLDLRGTQVTGAGRVRLKKLLPQCYIPKQYLKDDPSFAALKKMGAVFRIDNDETVLSINLSGTKITDADLEHLKGRMSLETLNLSGTQITDAGLEQLEGLTSIERLELSSTQVTDAGLEHLQGLVNLKSLGLDDSQVTDAGLVLLKGLANLQSIDLRKTQVTDAGLAHLQGLVNLKSLGLDDSQVTDAGLVHLKGLANLQSIDLRKTQVSDAGLEHLQGLVKLKSLGLDNSQVTDAGLVHLKGLTNLQSIDLRKTQVTDAGREHLQAALPKCQINSNGVPYNTQKAVEQVVLNPNDPNSTLPIAKAPGNYLPGLIPEPTYIPKFGRWQVITRLPRGIMRSAVFSPDEKLIAVGEAGNVRIYDAESFQLIRVLVGHTGHVSAIDWHPSGNQLASSSYDGTVRLWTVNGVPTHVLNGHTDEVHDVKWHPNGEQLASAGADKTVRIWNTDGTPNSILRDHKDHVFSIDWNADGTQLTSGGGSVLPPDAKGNTGDNVVRVWDVKNEVVTKRFPGHKLSIRCLDFSPDGKLLASAGGNFSSRARQQGSVRLWNLSDGEVKTVWEHPIETRSLETISWSPDGRTLAADGYRDLYLWNIDDVAVRKNLGNFGRYMTSIHWHSGGTKLLVAGEGSMSLVKVDGTPIPHVESHVPTVVPNLNKWWFGIIDWSRDGKWIAAAGQLWDPQGRPAASHATGEDGMAFSPDSQWVVVPTTGGKLQLIKPDGSLGTEIDPAGSNEIHWTGQSQKIVVSSGDAVEMWGLDGKLKHRVKLDSASNAGISEIACQAQGNLIAAALEDGSVWIGDDAGNVVCKFSVEAGSRPWKAHLDWSPDGNRLVTSGTDLLRVWRSDGTLETTIDAPLVFPAWSPDGKWIATGDYAGNVKLYSPDGAPGPVFNGHCNGGVSALAWGPDSKRLASASHYDSCLIVRNIETGKVEWVVLPLTYHDIPITLSPSGQNLHDEQNAAHEELLYLIEEQNGATRVIDYYEFHNIEDPPFTLK